MDSFDKTGCLTSVVIAFATFIIAFIFSLIFAWPFMLLWNWLIPVIFGLTTITFWQAFGLMVLCSFLFKGSTVSTSSK